jgi:hypothetical protein
MASAEKAVVISEKAQDWKKAYSVNFFTEKRL